MLSVWRVCRHRYCKTLSSLTKRPTRCLTTTNLSSSQAALDFRLESVAGDAADDQVSDERTRQSYVMQAFEDRVHSRAQQFNQESEMDLRLEEFKLTLRLSEQNLQIKRLRDGTADDSPMPSKDSLSDKEQRKADLINFFGEQFDEIAMDLHQQKLKSKKLRTHALSVSGLNMATTEADLMKIFSAYGKVKRLKLQNDFRTREFMGSAVVQFATEEAAGAAVEALDNSIFLGQCLKVAHKLVDRAYDVEENPARNSVFTGGKQVKDQKQVKGPETSGEEGPARTKKPKENLERWKMMNESNDQQESEMDWLCASCQARNYSTRRVCRECAAPRDRKVPNKSFGAASERQDTRQDTRQDMRQDTRQDMQQEARQDTRYNKRNHNRDFQQDSNRDHRKNDIDDFGGSRERHASYHRFQPRYEAPRQWNNDFRGEDREEGRSGGMRGRGGHGGRGRGGGEVHQGRETEGYDERAPDHYNSQHGARRERGGAMRRRGGRGAREGRDDFNDERMGDYFEDHVQQQSGRGGMRGRGRGGQSGDRRSQDIPDYDDDDDDDDDELNKGEHFQRDTTQSSRMRGSNNTHAARMRNGLNRGSSRDEIGVNQQAADIEEWRKKLDAMDSNESSASMEQLLAEEKSIRSSEYSNDDAYIEDDEMETAFGRSGNSLQEGRGTFSPFRGSSRGSRNPTRNNRFRGKARGKAQY